MGLRQLEAPTSQYHSSRVLGMCQPTVVFYSHAYTPSYVFTYMCSFAGGQPCV